MKQRIIVAVIGIPLLLAILCVAPDWATAALLAALSVVGTHELLAAVCGPEKTRRWTALPAVMGILVVLHFYGAGHGWQLPLGIVDGLLLVGVIALPAAGVLTYGKPHALTLLDVCVMALAGLAIPASFSCLLLLRLLPYGGGLVLVPLVAAFCSDSAALFTGMACGKHKLSPLVSPHKTVEGAVGGLVGGVLGMVIFRIVFYFCTLVPLHIGWCVLLGLVGGIFLHMFIMRTVVRSWPSLAATVAAAKRWLSVAKDNAMGVPSVLVSFQVKGSPLKEASYTITSAA